MVSIRKADGRIGRKGSLSLEGFKTCQLVLLITTSNSKRERESETEREKESDTERERERKRIGTKSEEVVL